MQSHLVIYFLLLDVFLNVSHLSYITVVTVNDLYVYYYLYKYASICEAKAIFSSLAFYHFKNCLTLTHVFTVSFHAYFETLAHFN